MVIPKVQTCLGNPYFAMRDFFESLRNDWEEFTVQSKLGASLTTLQGGTLTIPPAALISNNGQPCKKPVTIKLRTVNNKKDLFFMSKSTLSSERLLDVDLLLEIKMISSQQVKVDLAKPIRVEIPYQKTGRPGSLQLFEERTAPTKAMFSNEKLDWKPSQRGVILQRNPNAFRSAQFTLLQEGCYALGKYLTNPKKQPKKNAMLSVVLQDRQLPYDDCQAYLLFHDTNSVVRLHQQRHRFSAFHLPSGKKASLLVIGMKHGTFFAYKALIPAINSQKLKVQLNQINPDGLKSKLLYMNY